MTYISPYTTKPYTTSVTASWGKVFLIRVYEIERRLNQHTFDAQARRAA